MRKNFATLITTLVSLFVFVACSNDEQELFGQARQAPTGSEEITVKVVPQDSLHVDLVDEEGTPVVPFLEWKGFAGITTQPTLRADATEPWQPGQQLVREQLPQQAETNFSFNHGTNTVKTSVKFVVAESKVYDLGDGRKVVLTKGQELELYKPERLNLKGGEPTTEVKEGRLYYAETAVKYSLRYEDRVLAEGIQNFVAEEGYVPSWVCNQWFARHNAFIREASRSNNTVSVRCNNIATFWKLFDDNSHRDSLDINYTVLNKFNMTVPEMEVEDKTTLYNKSFAFTAETATVQGNNVKAEWQSAAIETNISYNSVNYKDSIDPCVAYAKNLVFNADATAVTVYFFEKGVVSGEDYATVTWPVTVKETVKFKELVKEFKHNAFRSNATVSGSNIAVLCDNTATFQKVYTDGHKDEAKSVKYVVTNNFTYSMPAYISGGAKGKTYTFNSTTAVVEGKNVTVTFASRVIGDIVYENTNYKSDKAVPQCEVAVKSIKFNDATATITFSHDKETVTAEVPVTYNSVKGYEMVGNPIHDSWNAAYGTSTGFGITCNNHVVVREVYTDGSKGSSFDLPYKSTNTWTVSGKTSFQVESLSSVLNVRHDIVNGSANIAGNVINFAHSMSAEKVSKGTFSYQPSACEAVARYITVTSSTTARVDIYHDNKKVGDYIIPVNITEPHNPDFPGRIIWGGATDSYVDGANVATWEGTYMHFIVENNGAYKVYSRKVGTDGWTSTDVSATYATSISNSKPAAFIGNTVAGYSLGSCQWQDQGSWTKIVYFDYNGNVARVISEISKTIGGESSNNCRMPLIGTWANGKITVDGTTYVVTGSQN